LKKSSSDNCQLAVCSSLAARRSQLFPDFLSLFRNPPLMIAFFQVLFFGASLVLLVMNFLDFNKWRESRKSGAVKIYPIRWFQFILTSLVALGCFLNILVGWISKA
jgi:hypothetical protein